MGMGVTDLGSDPAEGGAEARADVADVAVGELVGRTRATPPLVLMCTARHFPVLPGSAAAGPVAWQQPATVTIPDLQADASTASAARGHLWPGSHHAHSAQGSVKGNATTAYFLGVVRAEYARAELQAKALREVAKGESSAVGRKFAMSSEAYLKWALWRQNVSVALETIWCVDALGYSLALEIPHGR